MYTYYIHTIYICDIMARQISISDELYAELSEEKGKKSFTEVIKESRAKQKKKIEIAKSKAADDRLLARMKKGYHLGKIIGTRDDWHAR